MIYSGRSKHSASIRGNRKIDSASPNNDPRRSQVDICLDVDRIYCHSAMNVSLCLSVQSRCSRQEKINS